MSTWYGDADGDGYGTGTISISACDAPDGFVANNSDCNDGNPDIHPAAAETCDDIDNDCDGSTDEGVMTAWYTDLDYDGYGSGSPIYACENPGSLVSEDGDCNDGNSDINPAYSHYSYETWDSPSGPSYDWNCDGEIEQWKPNLYSFDYDATAALIPPGSDTWFPCVDFVPGWDWYVPDCGMYGTYIGSCAMAWGPWGYENVMDHATTMQACR